MMLLHELLRRRLGHPMALPLLLFLITAAACGDTETDAVTESSTTTTATATTGRENVEPDDASNGTEAVALADPDWSELERWHLGAIGGVSFGIRPDYVVHHDNHMITIRPRFELDRGRSLPAMVIAKVSSNFIQPIEGLDDFINPSGFGSSEPNGRVLELFGMTLVGYSFVADSATAEPIYMYPAYGAGYEGASAWQPYPLAELFAIEVPDGVIAVGYVAANETELAEAEEIFETVAPTLELDDPNAVMSESSELLSPIVAADYANAPVPIELPDEGPPILTQAFAPLDPGTYRSAHLGTPMTFTVDDGWWVQFNFPGDVVLSGADSFGPGDRGLHFQLGKTELVAAVVGPRAIGETIDFSDLEAFAAEPPANLLVENLQVEELGGLTTTRLDIIVDPTADCTEVDPCQYVWPADLPYPSQSMQPGYTTRVWRVDGADQPLLITAQSPEPSWLDEADAVVRTLEFG